LPLPIFIGGAMLTERQKRNFWVKVGVADPDECWLWLGAKKTKSGYGGFRVGGRSYRAHVLMYLLQGGVVNHGDCVLHSCDNPTCVNPKHLRSGTQIENIADMVSKGRNNSPSGEDHGRSKLNTADVLTIRKLHVEGRSTKGIAADFHVARSTIQFVIERKTWRHIS